MRRPGCPHRRETPSAQSPKPRRFSRPLTGRARAGKPYTSQILLAGTGIATDLTRYLMRSEQIASAVLLGVLNKRDGVAAAGGMIIQAFPHAPEEAISAVEKAVREAPSLSKLLETMEIEEAVATVLQGTGYKQVDAGYTVPVSYACQCTPERALAPLALLGLDELEEMIAEGGTEVVCQFCGRRYQFGPDDVWTFTATHGAATNSQYVRMAADLRRVRPYPARVRPYPARVRPYPARMRPYPARMRPYPAAMRPNPAAVRPAAVSFSAA